MATSLPRAHAGASSWATAPTTRLSGWETSARKPSFYPIHRTWTVGKERAGGARLPDKGEHRQQQQQRRSRLVIPPAALAAPATAFAAQPTQGSPGIRGERFAATTASSAWSPGYGIATQSLLDRTSRREQSWTSMDPYQERGDKMSPLLGENRINHSMDRAVDGDFIQDLSFPTRR